MTTAATAADGVEAMAATTTEPRQSDARAAAPDGAARRPGPAAVTLGSLGAFFALLAVLAVQVRAGGDPALGSAEPAAQRRVIVHRVVLRRVVVTEPARRSSVLAASGSDERALARSAATPAPAPVTTGSS